MEFGSFPMNLMKSDLTCVIIPSLTVNKHQSTGKPLNKGFLVLL